MTDSLNRLYPEMAEPMPPVDPLREALEEIAGLTTYLRQGGPDPMDLQGLSDALDHATDLAHSALATPDQFRGVAQTPTISVQPMALSDNRTDYWVSIKVGDRKITPYVFRDEQFKAEYEAASFRWLLLGEPKPDLMAYSEAGWPASTLPSTKLGSDE